ncbi:MAG: alpha-glucan family phosphorylase, partial [Planctomycetales bacterium]|nr:alpha-glucan family phosphorylase [Planctomycetales bacterium]
MESQRRIAYFTMEIAVHPDVPTYSGGLGILAGDTIRSAADLHVPMVAVSLLHRKGYFYQRLDSRGVQSDEPVRWPINDYLVEQEKTCSVKIEGRDVKLRAWKYVVRSANEFVVPVFFLDADLPENAPQDRALTDHLYGGDDRYRLCQEILLGIGGVRMLRTFGYARIERFHMNEGHAALLTLELLREHRESAGRQEFATEDIYAVRKKCVFTTHTPVPAGHDQFDLDLVRDVLGSGDVCQASDIICHAGRLNMTYLALALSHYVNGVAKKHSEVSQSLFAEYTVDAITNGVHAEAWVSPPFAELYDRFMKHWRRDNFSLRYAIGLEDNDIWLAHQKAKSALVEYVNRESNAGFDVDVLTLGFGRRATAYKRPCLIFNDVERLKRISNELGKLQIVLSGKAHPADENGKRLIQQVVDFGKQLGDSVPVAYLANYDQHVGHLMTSGVDVWLNTPEPPKEASGTSGMKAAMNGVPSLSVLDGWWIEGCVEGVTGWAFGDSTD